MKKKEHKRQESSAGELHPERDPERADPSRDQGGGIVGDAPAERGTQAVEEGGQMTSWRGARVRLRAPSAVMTSMSSRRTPPTAGS